MNLAADIFYEHLFPLLYLIPEQNALAEKPFLVVTTQQELSTLQQELLNKILQAVKIDPAQCRQVSIGNFSESLLEACRYAFFFVDLNKLPKNIASFGNYALVSINLKKIIVADDLDQLANNVNNKKKLWKILQQAFQ
ncbi:MAG: DNA polymerase III subunit psi [Cytophagales bacterium]|nr:DNA polymerase III subunit psi [Bernardetiaceae bacterium]MDW8210821.1 DNA polymerase III subunit psi [Cytophagales bacterium]